MIQNKIVRCGGSSIFRAIHGLIRDKWNHRGSLLHLGKQRGDAALTYALWSRWIAPHPQLRGDSLETCCRGCGRVCLTWQGLRPCRCQRSGWLQSQNRSGNIPSQTLLALWRFKKKRESQNLAPHKQCNKVKKKKLEAWQDVFNIYSVSCINTSAE